MYNYFDESDKGINILLAIGYSKKLYDEQVNKVKKEEYIKDLLLEDYAQKIRAHHSRYDYIDIFDKAQNEVGKRLKKERPHLETIKHFVLEDFLNNDKTFKLDKIISCGIEGYAWRLEFKGYGKTIFIEIPIMKHITSKNLEHASYGMFTFGVYESDYCYRVLKQSYEIKAIANFITAYFDEKGDDSNK